MFESREDVTPVVADANRRRLAVVVACVLDLLYLLLAYALLRTPLTEELRLVLPVVVAATIVTAIAALVWLVLVVRMQVLAGAPGILLGLLLGAPLLLSLPLLDGRIVGDVPTIASSAVAWVVGIVLLLLLVGIRSRLNHYSRAALGGRLDRGLLGTYAANDELAHARRQSAFGRIVGALIDVVLLVLAYWIVAVPIASALVRSTGYEWIGTAALALLLAAVLAVLGVAVLQSRRTLDETGGPAWRARATALARAVFAAGTAGGGEWRRRTRRAGDAGRRGSARATTDALGDAHCRPGLLAAIRARPDTGNARAGPVVHRRLQHWRLPRDHSAA